MEPSLSWEASPPPIQTLPRTCGVSSGRTPTPPQESMQAVLAEDSGLHPSPIILKSVGRGVPSKHRNLSPRGQWG